MEPRNGRRNAAFSFVSIWDFPMAKPATVKIKLVSSADTGFFYVTKKNPRTQTEKMSFRKYDPVARKHVEFKEPRSSKPSAHSSRGLIPGRTRGIPRFFRRLLA